MAERLKVIQKAILLEGQRNKRATEWACVMGTFYVRERERESVLSHSLLMAQHTRMEMGL